MVWPPAITSAIVTGLCSASMGQRLAGRKILYAAGLEAARSGARKRPRRGHGAGAMIGGIGARYGHWRTSPNPLDVAPDVALAAFGCEIGQVDMA